MTWEHISSEHGEYWIHEDCRVGVFKLLGLYSTALLSSNNPVSIGANDQVVYLNKLHNDLHPAQEEALAIETTLREREADL